MVACPARTRSALLRPDIKPPADITAGLQGRAPVRATADTERIEPERVSAPPATDWGNWTSNRISQPARRRSMRPETD